jgi:hypothetical protein
MSKMQKEDDRSSTTGKTSNQLISFCGWDILDGGLRAKKTGEKLNIYTEKHPSIKHFLLGSGFVYDCLRAEKPFPISAGACTHKQNGQLIYFFEVTVITKGGG